MELYFLFILPESTHSFPCWQGAARALCSICHMVLLLNWIVFFRTVLLSAPNSAKAGQIFHPTSAMGFSAVYCTACYLLLFAPVMAVATLQSRGQHCKGRNCVFSLFIDIFRQHCKIAIIHPLQPLRHCRAPCQGCNAADSDLWYTLPDVFDEIFVTQCAARMVIGAFTASSFF